MNIIKYIETLFQKENTVKNVSNFTPYGTDPKKDKMVKSNYWKSRLKMAKEGYGLDVLIIDEDDDVREAVAEQGYGLDILINDENRIIRKIVAKQGYDLNILINDEKWGVRKAVRNYLKENNLTLAEWCNQNNKEIDLRKLAFSPYPEARIAAIESGYIYKKGEIYIDSNCKFIPYSTDSEKDKMVKSDNWKDRLKMAEEGYGLDILINDEDYNVREAVAKQGYGLDILINDEDSGVRAEVVKQGYGLNILINDKDWSVRTEVAKQGYGLNILIYDEGWIIRETVAEQGYGLDVLIYDENYEVRKAVRNYLTAHKLTLEQWKFNQDFSKTDIINQAKNAINEGKINIKNVADNIKSTKSVLNDRINKTNKTNEIELFKLD